jgi:hypothetical protein
MPLCIQQDHPKINTTLVQFEKRGGAQMKNQSTLKQKKRKLTPQNKEVAVKYNP